MPAIQPIPQNSPSTSDTEAARLLADHNRRTDARKKSPADWAPTTQRGSVPGENAGTRVK